MEPGNASFYKGNAIYKLHSFGGSMVNFPGASLKLTGWKALNFSTWKWYHNGTDISLSQTGEPGNTFGDLGNSQPSFLGVISHNSYFGSVKPSFLMVKPSFLMVLGSKGSRCSVGKSKFKLIFLVLWRFGILNELETFLKLIGSQGFVK